MSIQRIRRRDETITALALVAHALRCLEVVAHGDVTTDPAIDDYAHFLDDHPNPAGVAKSLALLLAKSMHDDHGARALPDVQAAIATLNADPLP